VRLVPPVLAAILIFSLPRPVIAQAWVPDKGEGTVSVLFQDAVVKDHFFSRGQREDRGEIQSGTLLTDLTYGITDRLAVTVGVPLIRTKYRGAAPHPTSQDDGSANYGLQDVRGSVRYNVLRGPLVVTPFVGTNMPTHKYQYFAHAALGIRVREVEVGTYVGYVPGRVLPNAFVQARYAHGFPQTIAGVERRKSYLDLEVGYFVTPRLRMFTMAVGYKTHGGIDVPDAGYRMLPPALQEHHDRVGRIELLDASGGVQYTLNRSVDVFGSFTRSLAGRYTHAIDRAFSVGVAWSFGRNRTLQDLLGDDPGPDESLIRCLCQK
jgi:hypothetical protein